ncbi:MAG: ABC transporter ATP-binding protein, partial [Lachnospiraceae bacterium]|nr:ABC transporter ATP-binding protein [Lachnospiraceae bacterium]
MKRLIRKTKKYLDDRNVHTSYLKWLMSYSVPYIPRIVFIMLLNLAGTGLGLAMTLVAKKIIDDAGSGFTVWQLLVAYLGIVVVIQIVEVIVTLISTMLNERFSFGIRKQLYEKIINSHWLDVKKYHTGDLMTRLTSDAGNIADGVISTIPNIIKLIVELIVVFFTLFYFSPFLACLALMVAPISAIVSFWFGRKLKRLTVKVQETESAYRSFLQESMANLLIVKAFRNEAYSTERLVQLREERFYWVFKKTKFGLVSSTTMSMAFQIGYIAAFSYGAIQMSQNLITYGTMSVFLTLVNRVQAPVLQLAQQIPKVVSVIASSGRVMELERIPAEEHIDKHELTDNIGVKVDELSFGYVADEAIFDDAMLDVKPGEFVAIIGESGIGKTTLIRLLMSFMSGTSGSITYYDKEGKEERSNASSRDFISYVPQGNTLFSGTIRENIRMGKLDATEEEMIEALKMAAAYDFV